MRSILVAGAIALVSVPAAIYAQSTTDQSTTNPTAGPSDAMGDTANPMATSSGTPNSSGTPAGMSSEGAASNSMGGGNGGTGMAGSSDSGMSSGSGSSMQSAPMSTPSNYPVCSKTVRDECRNRGGK